MGPNTKEVDPPQEVLRELCMDPETGFVEVCLRHGDVVRPLLCEELEMDDEALFAMFGRNALLDTPEGPVAISPADWQRELSGVPLFARPTH